MSEVERFFIPTKATAIGTFRAFRSYVARLAAAKGEKLDPEWYADGPEQCPELYKDQPEVLAALKKKQEDQTDANH